MNRKYYRALLVKNVPAELALGGRVDYDWVQSFYPVGDPELLWTRRSAQERKDRIAHKIAYLFLIACALIGYGLFKSTDEGPRPVRPGKASPGKAGAGHAIDSPGSVPLLVPKWSVSMPKRWSMLT